MEIRNWTQYVDRGDYVGVISGVKNTGNGNEQPASKTDSMVISDAARKAAMVAEMEKDGLSREAAEKMVSGKLTINEPDWETFEVPTLQGQADRKIFDTAYFQTYAKVIGEATERVQAYYAPELSNMKGMNSADAMDYLFKTYKMPWMEDMFVKGTNIPAPPDGMSKDEADMAYNQLKSMYLGKGISILRDPYALGTDGLEKLNNAHKYANEVAQEAYDAAQKEYEGKQEEWKAEQKEKIKHMYDSINSGTSTCMGYMALRPKTETEGNL